VWNNICHDCQGFLVGSMQAGVLPCSPTSFRTVVAKVLPVEASAIHPPRRRAVRAATAPPPHRSVRLAKKTERRIPMIATAQNALMKKLGLITGEHVESDEFNQYIKQFRDGLSEDQEKMIDELFMNKVPAQPEVEVDEVA
jgi:hypothetical protein